MECSCSFQTKDMQVMMKHRKNCKLPIGQSTKVQLPIKIPTYKKLDKQGDPLHSPAPTRVETKPGLDRVRFGEIISQLQHLPRKSATIPPLVSETPLPQGPILDQKERPLIRAKGKDALNPKKGVRKARPTKGPKLRPLFKGTARVGEKIETKVKPSLPTPSLTTTVFHRTEDQSGELFLQLLDTPLWDKEQLPIL